MSFSALSFCYFGALFSALGTSLVFNIAGFQISRISERFGIRQFYGTPFWIWAWFCQQKISDPNFFFWADQFFLENSIKVWAQLFVCKILPSRQDFAELSKNEKFLQNSKKIYYFLLVGLSPVVRPWKINHLFRICYYHKYIDQILQNKFCFISLSSFSGGVYQGTFTLLTFGVTESIVK